MPDSSVRLAMKSPYLGSHTVGVLAQTLSEGPSFMQSTRSVEGTEVSALPSADPIQSTEKAQVELPNNSSTRSVALEPGMGVMLPELEPGVRSII